MKNIYPFIVILTLTTFSCQKETATATDFKRNVVPFTEVGKKMKDEQATVDLNNQKKAQTENQKKLNIQEGINPAHGIAGHRCDIAVGESLNKTPEQNISAPLQKTIQVPENIISTVTKPTEKSITPEGMNPPHGQVNHRCDIAIGAPLPK